MKFEFKDEMIVDKYLYSTRNGFEFGFKVNFSPLTPLNNRGSTSYDRGYGSNIDVEKISNWRKLDIQDSYDGTLCVAELYPFLTYGFYRSVTPPEIEQYRSMWVNFDSGPELLSLTTFGHYDAIPKSMLAGPYSRIYYLQGGNVRRAMVSSEFLQNYFIKNNLDWELLPEHHGECVARQKNPKPLVHKSVYSTCNTGEFGSQVRFYIDENLSYESYQEMHLGFSKNKEDAEDRGIIFEILLGEDPYRSPHNIVKELFSPKSILSVLENHKTPERLRDSLIFNLDCIRK